MVAKHEEQELAHSHILNVLINNLSTRLERYLSQLGNCIELVFIATRGDQKFIENNAKRPNISLKPDVLLVDVDPFWSVVRKRLLLHVSPTVD